MNKANKIQVVRYLRDTSTINDNLHAITFVFDLDYGTRTVTAKWAICNGDNFNKKSGINIASERKDSFSFPMEDVKDSQGLVNALWDNIHSRKFIYETMKGKNAILSPDFTYKDMKDTLSWYSRRM